MSLEGTSRYVSPAGTVTLPWAMSESFVSCPQSRSTLPFKQVLSPLLLVLLVVLLPLLLLLLVPLLFLLLHFPLNKVSLIDQPLVLPFSSLRNRAQRECFCFRICFTATNKYCSSLHQQHMGT